MNPKKKLLFIINPIAGTRKKRTLPALIEERINKDLFDYKISYTEYRGHAKELAQIAVKEEIDNVIAVGGDGTINEVASGLMFSNTALGIIPCGSGNGLARHLKISIGNEKAIDIIQKQNVKRIDAGMANGKAFFCTAGIGFDAHIGQLFAKSTRRGFNTYFKTAFRELFYYNPISYQVQTGEELVTLSAFSITLANASQFGNNAYISPEADIEDGFLDLCIVKVYPKREAINLVIKLFNKTLHKSGFVTIKKIKEVTIKAPEAKCYHLDGEFLELEGDLQIQVSESCLNVLVP